jgi:hypothetical protein
MKKVLTSLGYREIRANVWGKPFGNHLITFEFDKLLWTNWFTGDDGKNLVPLIWDSKTYEAETNEFEETVKHDFKEFIIEAEAWTNVQGHMFSDFSFLSVAEVLNFELES